MTLMGEDSLARAYSTLGYILNLAGPARLFAWF